MRVKSLHPRGLSLLELAVVLAVVGIVAAISVNSFLGVTQRERSLTALKEVHAQVAKARQLASTRNQPVRITVSGPVLVNGRAHAAVRWEALPCSDVYGTNCPVPACLTNPCGSGGCNCVALDGGLAGTSGEVGPPGQPVPGLLVAADVLTLPPALDGLCFQGGAAAPLLRNGGTDCQAGGPAIALNTFPFVLPGQSRLAYLQVEPTTGITKLLDCNASPDAGICP